MSAAPDGIRVLYFAWLRDRVGTDAELVVPPPGVENVGGLRDWLATRSPRHAHAFAQASVIRCAVNQEVAALTHPVAPGDEVAFFPPVTGG